MAFLPVLMCETEVNCHNSTNLVYKFETSMVRRMYRNRYFTTERLKKKKLSKLASLSFVNFLLSIILNKKQRKNSEVDVPGRVSNPGVSIICVVDNSQISPPNQVHPIFSFFFRKRSMSLSSSFPVAYSS